ncbi:CLUMA_CG016985, isoform A [Clunio marinus]|uniref:CLUMA_CG016985, isoform A n=1 Tax=Clunio marinus TaxID=568069 RepID=A0A1J1IUJ2_9DIPT|nr:CLUMA_CG016985, isoform A [Clunio marinus]
MKFVLILSVFVVFIISDVKVSKAHEICVEVSKEPETEEESSNDNDGDSSTNGEENDGKEDDESSSDDEENSSRCIDECSSLGEDVQLGILRLGTIFNDYEENEDSERFLTLGHSTAFSDLLNKLKSGETPDPIIYDFRWLPPISEPTDESKWPIRNELDGLDILLFKDKNKLDEDCYPCIESEPFIDLRYQLRFGERYYQTRLEKKKEERKYGFHLEGTSEGSEGSEFNLDFTWKF